MDFADAPSTGGGSDAHAASGACLAPLSQVFHASSISISAIGISLLPFFDHHNVPSH